jgi:hypothetical protein
MQLLRPGGGKVPTGNINKSGPAAGWTKVNGKLHVECDNVGHFDVRFMCGNRKYFNEACGLKKSIADSQLEHEHSITPSHNQTNSYTSLLGRNNRHFLNGPSPENPHSLLKPRHSSFHIASAAKEGIHKSI